MMFKFVFLEVTIVYQKVLLRDKAAIHRLFLSTCGFSQSRVCGCVFVLLSIYKPEERGRLMDCEDSVHRGH